ncbi:MAG: hypothetical protein AB7H97_09605 [Pseudobdellovibrionaceae bacterium]
MRIIMLLLLTLSFVSCEKSNKLQQGDWLSGGSADDRFERVSKHLRGFDMAMVETGYRYTELFWAGRDQNWEYANYQIEKIELAIKNGTERRPKRTDSAQMIFPVIADLKGAVTEMDLQKFNKGFSRLTVTCNACHEAEKVSFFKISSPKHRLSPVTAAIKSLDRK